MEEPTGVGRLIKGAGGACLWEGRRRGGVRLGLHDGGDRDFERETVALGWASGLVWSDGVFLKKITEEEKS